MRLNKLKNNINYEVKKLSNDIHHIIFNDSQELYLIGTAHVSADSVEIVEKTIREFKPDTIAVELDAQRLDVMKNKKKYEETDIVQIIKKKKVFFFIAQLVLSSYQKRIAKKLGIKPGAEFKKAIDLAEETGANLILADRNIAITLKRVTRKLTFWDKIKLFSSLFFMGKEEKNIDEEKIKEIKDSDNLEDLINEMGKIMPVIKTILLDERNIYLAAKIKENLGKINIAVVGAAHVPGIIECLNGDISQHELDNLDIIPPKSRLSKIVPWIIPGIILVLFILGFIYGNYEQIGQAAIYWILVNGILTAIGCLLAFGHPLTIVAGFIAAPITSLNPMIGAGMVAGLVQLFLVRPKVKDFEMAGDDITNIKGLWRNRLTRTLLVFVFASLGSSIGTFAAFPFILRAVS